MVLEASLIFIIFRPTRMSTLKIITPLLVLICCCVLIPQQALGQFSIIGQIVDSETQKGIPKATIRINGWQNVDFTDEQGSFSIDNPSEILKITVSHPKYKERTLTVLGKPTVKVALIPNNPRPRPTPKKKPTPTPQTNPNPTQNPAPPEVRETQKGSLNYTGFVFDLETRKPIENSLVAGNSGVTTFTSEDGYFALHTNSPLQSLTISAKGYAPYMLEIPTRKRNFHVLLSPPANASNKSVKSPIKKTKNLNETSVGNVPTEKPILSGKILNQLTGEGLPNVAIRINKWENVVFSDTKGDFKIFRPTKLDSLTVKLDGFQTWSIENPNLNKSLNIQLIPSNIDLPEVNILASRSIGILKSTEAVRQVNQKSLQLNDQISFSPILNSIPGVHLQEGALNTTRLSIRGVGALSPFNTRYLRTFINGIPITFGSMETNIDDLDLSLLNNIKIIKGPSSHSFGPGLGGILQANTFALKDPNNSLSTKFIAGGFGRFKADIGVQYNMNNTLINFGASTLSSDGFRANNAVSKNNLNIFAQHSFKSGMILQGLILMNQNNSEIPSALDEATYNSAPESAATSWEATNAKEDYNRTVAGIKLSGLLGKYLSGNAVFFSGRYENDEIRPFNILNEKYSSLGSRLEVQSLDSTWVGQLSGKFGLEIFYESQEFETFQNIGGIGEKGETIRSNTGSDFWIGPYTSWRIQPTKKWSIELGASAYGIQKTDMRADTSQDVNTNWLVFSPKIGFNYSPTKTINAYFNFSNGHHIPGGEELRLSNGAINSSLKSMQARNLEIGLNALTLDNKLQSTLNYFYINTNNLIASAADTFGGRSSINYPGSIHNGLELELVYNTPKGEGIITNSTFQLAATIGSYKYKDHTINGVDIGKQNIPGTSPLQVSAKIIQRTSMGFTGHLALNYYGGGYADDLNNIEHEAYALLNARVNYVRNIYERLNGQVFLGANNIFDTKYASMVSINARGTMPRYFYPGTPFDIYGGVKLTYTFN